MIKLNIPLIPTAQKRARHTVRKGFSVTYKDPAQRDNEESIKAFLALNSPQKPLPGPLILTVKAFLPVPNSWARVKKEKAFSGELRPITKPDLDNLVKNIKDCLTQMRYWEDDKQVVGFGPGTGKYYSDDPRWEIKIEPYAWHVAERWGD